MTQPVARVARLDTARDVRRELGRLYRAGRRGDIPTSDAGRLASILATLLKSIETSAIEERLDSLEAHHEQDH